MDEATKITDWVITKSLDDTALEEYCKDIISTPSAVFVEPNNGAEKRTPLYSKEQLIEAFKIGYTTMSHTEFGKRILRAHKLQWLKPHDILRNMDVGGYTTFPFEKWSAVRTAASHLKKSYGCKFSVRKMGPNGKVADIEVVRLQ